MLGALGLPACGAATGADFFLWLAAVLPFDEWSNGAFAFLGLTIGCLLVALALILALRQLTADMPTMEDEKAALQRMAQGDFSDSEALLRSSRFVRGMGVLFAVAGGCLIAVDLAWMSEYGWLDTLTILGAVFFVVGITFAVWGRLPRGLQRIGRKRSARPAPYRQRRQ